VNRRIPTRGAAAAPDVASTHSGATLQGGATTPVVAIIGRPNVGKSMLFNRITKSRRAIVEDVPGVTRDRQYAETTWRGRRFRVVDTGGLRTGAADRLGAQVRKQVQAAIADASVVLLVVDARDGLVAEDSEIAEMARRAHVPVLLVANKVDDASGEAAALEFHALGLGTPFPVSAYHGRGTGDLLDAVVALLPEAADGAEPAAGIAVAIVGRPNVGKSSLINALLGEERVVVDATPGTTRDAIDSLLVRADKRYVLIDTAGLRRRARVERGIESFSAARTRQAIERADVAVLVLDATEPIADQDQRIGRAIADAGCGVVIALNKWDLVTRSARSDRRRDTALRHALRFLDYAAIVATSATTGLGLDELFQTIDRVAENHRTRIGTGVLNRVVADAVAAHEPPADRSGRRLKIYYATQPARRPPTVVLFVNEPSRLPDAYLRFLGHAIRQAVDLSGVPLRFIVRRRRGEEDRA
jgi:GTP-binding protein